MDRSNDLFITKLLIEEIDNHQLEYIGIVGILNNEKYNRCAIRTFRMESGLNRFTRTQKMDRFLTKKTNWKLSHKGRKIWYEATICAIIYS